MLNGLVLFINNSWQRLNMNNYNIECILNKSKSSATSYFY